MFFWRWWSYYYSYVGEPSGNIGLKGKIKILFKSSWAILEDQPSNQRVKIKENCSLTGVSQVSFRLKKFLFEGVVISIGMLSLRGRLLGQRGLTKPPFDDLSLFHICLSIELLKNKKKKYWRTNTKYWRVNSSEVLKSNQTFHWRTTEDKLLISSLSLISTFPQKLLTDWRSAVLLIILFC